MLQLNVLRQDANHVKERLSFRHFAYPELVDEIVELDEERKKWQTEYDNIQSKINSSSRKIGKWKAQGNEDEIVNIREKVTQWKTALDPIKKKMGEAENALNEKILLLPNLPSSKVPPGKSAADNVVVRSGGNDKPDLPANPLPHWDLITKFDIIDFETGAKVTGRGFPIYKGKGAKLQRSLIQYFLDYNTENGYTEFIPPFLVNADSAFGTGQLPDKEGQMYHVTMDDFYLIPTSEVPVTNMYRDVIVKEQQLPIKMTAYSPCFRREAGSFGKDVRGLNRLHQFEKVEIVQIVHPEKSYEVLEEMVDHVERLMQSLELPYRILKLCGGDMGFTSALTYDFEVFSAAQQRWLEVSSVSNFESYQSNRLKCRFKDETGKMQLVHTLNGSSLALPRIVASILENNQKESYIEVPQVLQHYFGSDRIEMPK